MNPSFKPRLMTQEDHIKSAALKEEKKAYALSHLKVEYMDADHWRGLAKEKGVRMPLWYISAQETKHVKRMAKKTNTDLDAFIKSTGFNTLKAFVNANPKMTAFATCGLYLEFLSDVHVYKDDEE